MPTPTSTAVINGAVISPSSVARASRSTVEQVDMSPVAVVARVRLCGGMLLMLYVICHLSNLSLGLWSLQLMEQWRHVIMVPWQSWIGQLLLYGALGSHVVLGLV